MAVSVPDDLPPRPDAPLDVAVSDCLTGSMVRFDGGHKGTSLPHESLARVFRLRGICPEVAIGLGVPRVPIQLVGDPSSPRARGLEDPGFDVTDRLRAYAQELAPSLAEVAGFIFMQGSPSCGLSQVKVHTRSAGEPIGFGRGIFADELTRLLPDLPVADCERLFDPVLRENFVTRTFVYAHWRRVVAAGLTAPRLLAFHCVYDELLEAHSASHHRAAARLLADGSGDVSAVAEHYVGVLMAGLERGNSRAS